MSKGATQAVIGLVALAAGFAAGWLVHSKPPVGPTQGTQVVHVGPHADQLSLDPVPISKSEHDVILWVGVTPGTDLLIETEQELFEQQTHGNSGRFAVSCHGRMCSSGDLLAAVGEGRFKYWQILRTPGQSDDVKDGWIIIDR